MQIKLSAVPTQTGAYTDPQEISNCFKQVFSECRLDSYTDIKSVTELFKKCRMLIMILAYLIRLLMFWMWKVS